MRLPRIIQRKKIPDLFLREPDIPFFGKELQSSPDSIHTIVMAGLYDLADRFRLRIISVSQDMVFPFLIFTGELDTRYEFRIPAFQKARDDGASLDCIMIGDREYRKFRFPYLFQDLLRPVRAVRNCRMHMQVDLNHSFIPVSQKLLLYYTTKQIAFFFV